jgi:hypothetical protein
MTSRVVRKLSTAYRLLRTRGPRAFIGWTLTKLMGGANQPTMLVAENDAARVDWTREQPWALQPLTVKDRPSRIAWIMSPPGETSGGHQNLFRFINFAEQAGHSCTIHLYDNQGAMAALKQIEAMIRNAHGYAPIKAELRVHDPSAGVGADVDAIFATGWETAYPAFLDASPARRFYFVQDFEAGFYPLGSQSLLAENTYRFGFHGITAGGWLADKLHAEYGMPTDSFDFAVDKSYYTVTNFERRNEIFFYARPVTPRRAFEFGILALKDFAAMRPDVTINLGGWDVSSWGVPFAHRNLAAMDVSELNVVYNRCAAGLVLSLSNMSLLPLELLSSGVTPVVNDAPNNRKVSDNPFIEYVPASPLAIAERLALVIDRPDGAERSVEMSRSVQNVNWADSGAQFVSAFERAMRG